MKSGSGSTRVPGRRSLVGVAAATVLVVSAALVAIPRSACAQRDWNRFDDPLQAALGVHAGKIGGVGLAYKYPLVWWLNVQLAGGIWHTEDHKRHNLGLELQYILRQDDRIRLFVGGGVGFFYHKQRKENPLDHTEFFTVSKTWNSGLGIGLEWLHTSRLSFQVEGDFTHEGDDDDFIFLPQVGLFFYF